MTFRSAAATGLRSRVVHLTLTGQGHRAPSRMGQTRLQITKSHFRIVSICIQSQLCPIPFVSRRCSECRCSSRVRSRRRVRLCRFGRHAGSGRPRAHRRHPRPMVWVAGRAGHGPAVPPAHCDFSQRCCDRPALACRPPHSDRSGASCPKPNGTNSTPDHKVPLLNRFNIHPESTLSQLILEPTARMGAAFFPLLYHCRSNAPRSNTATQISVTNP